MFASLIRRKSSLALEASGDAAFESTTVSLSTSVPRPIERRTDERLSAMLRVAKLTDVSGAEQLVRVKNLSAGGLAAIAGNPPEIGQHVEIEVSSQKIPASVVWLRDDVVGLKFDQDVDLGELLAGRKPRHGFRPRPPRLQIPCKASVRVGKVYSSVDVHDSSPAGTKLEPIAEYCVVKKVIVLLETFRPLNGEVRS